MQLKLKLTVVAAIAAAAGVASAQEQVVKIGHVAPVSGAQAHYGGQSGAVWSWFRQKKGEQIPQRLRTGA
ncbi:hypothetical protein ACQKEU_26850, partial [Acidovorax sp. NPDC077664]